MIAELDLKLYGWDVDPESGIVTPVWFRGPQNPLTMDVRINEGDVQTEAKAAKVPRIEAEDILDDDRLLIDAIEKELEYIYFGDSDLSEDGDSDFE